MHTDAKQFCKTRCSHVGGGNAGCKSVFICGKRKNPVALCVFATLRLSVRNRLLSNFQIRLITKQATSWQYGYRQPGQGR